MRYMYYYGIYFYDIYFYSSPVYFYKQFTQAPNKIFLKYFKQKNVKKYF